MVDAVYDDADNPDKLARLPARGRLDNRDDILIKLFTSFSPYDGDDDETGDDDDITDILILRLTRGIR